MTTHRPLSTIKDDLTLIDARLDAIKRQWIETLARHDALYKEEMEHPEWEAEHARECDRDLRETLGPFFYDVWVTKRGADPLSYLCAADGDVSLEFKQSGWLNLVPHARKPFQEKMVDLREKVDADGSWSRTFITLQPGWYNVTSEVGTRLEDATLEWKNASELWDFALKHARGDEKEAIVDVCNLAHQTLGDELNHSCGPAFLKALSVHV